MNSWPHLLALAASVPADPLVPESAAWWVDLVRIAGWPATTAIGIVSFLNSSLGRKLADAIPGRKTVDNDLVSKLTEIINQQKEIITQQTSFQNVTVEALEKTLSTLEKQGVTLEKQGEALSQHSQALLLLLDRTPRS